MVTSRRVRQQVTKNQIIWTSTEVKDHFPLLTEVSGVISKPFKTKFQVETHFNAHSKSKMKWHPWSCEAAGCGCLTHMPSTHFSQHWRLWSVFSPTCATAFVCYTLIVWLCNAAHQGQPCRAAGAWNKEVLGLDEIQFLFWNCTKWFLPACLSG